jgi:aminoglycoside phosphotransferase (APT) family kinase protein
MNGRSHAYELERGASPSLRSRGEVDGLLKEHPALAGRDLKLVGRMQITHSEILEYWDRSVPGSQHLIVKRIIRSQTPSAAALAVTKEFQALHALDRVTRGALEGSVPRAVLVIPEAHAIVLEKLPGRALDRLLKLWANRVAWTLRKKQLRVVGRLVGIWLAQFHRITRRSFIGHDSKSFLKELRSILDRCLNRGLEEPEAEAILTRATRLSMKLEGHLVPFAAKHGDFTPRNVLFDRQDRISLVDFENFSECCPVYEDVGSFVAYLALLKGRPYYSWEALDTVTRSFLNGYGIEPETELLSLYALKLGVTIFADGCSRGLISQRLGLTRLVTRALLREGDAG